MSHSRFIFGKWVDSDFPLSVLDAENICLEAATKQQSMRNIGQEKILHVLARLKALWQNPTSRYRKLSEEKLPEMTGFSLKMIQLGLDELALTLDPEVLEKKIRTELNGIPRSPLKKFEPQTGRFLCYEPLGTLFHVLSGNVFLVGPGSLLEGVLTGNVNIFKMSSSDTFFLPLFLESLEEVDDEKLILPHIALLDVSSKQKDVLEVFKKNVDAVVVWGGEEAAQSFREKLPARVRFVMFGPKLSFALVTHDGIRSLGMANVAECLANDLVVWDQNACTAPQLCFVQGKKNCNELASALGKALVTLSRNYPAGRPSADAASEIRKLRGVAEVAELRGQGALIDSGLENLDYTILVEDELKFETSPLNRTIRLMSYDDLEEIIKLTKPFKGYLQTVGLAATNAEMLFAQHQLGLCGAQRLLPLGQMSGGQIDDPHDGAYDLPQLMNLVVGILPKDSRNLDPWDLLSREDRLAVQNDQLLKIFRAAQKTRFYENILPEKFRGLCDLPLLPLMGREEWEANMPPFAKNLESRNSGGGYVTRSGGSSGTPKFSYFDKEDWSAMVKSAARMFRSCGLDSSDRIANLMSAGDLYGSFISFDHVSFELGAQIFAMGSHVESESFYEIVKLFGINTVLGFPPKISALFRAAKEKDCDFKIEKVLFAGQPMSPVDQEFLKNECGVKILSSVIGSTESNHLAYQCSELTKNHFHIPEDYNWLEIVDSEGNCVGTDQPGRIVITNLQKTNFPVLRFLNGDSGRILSRPCVCGRQDRVLEYLGRSDDILCLGVMNLKLSDFVKALEQFPILQLQLGASFRAQKDLLQIRIETSSPEMITTSNVTQVLLEKVPEFRQHLEIEKTFQLEIQVLSPGSLERSPRTGKIRSIVDER